jgi:hypothetical protein
MSNQKILKVINPIMALVFLTVATCAIIMTLHLFPQDITWGKILPIHKAAGKAFIFLAVCHIILNWNWIKSQIFGIKAKPQQKSK